MNRQVTPSSFVFFHRGIYRVERANHGRNGAQCTRDFVRVVVVACDGDAGECVNVSGSPPVASFKCYTRNGAERCGERAFVTHTYATYMRACLTPCRVIVACDR